MESLLIHSQLFSLTEGCSSKVQMTIEDIKPEDINDWYFCVLNYVSSEHGDVNMNFSHPIGPSEKFF